MTARIPEAMSKLSMVPLLVQSRDVPADVRQALQDYLTDPRDLDAGCEAAAGLKQAFDLSGREVLDLMGLEPQACCC